MPDSVPPSGRTDESESQTIALTVVATLLVVGASWLLAGLLVPFWLAVILAIALAPVATKLERFGLPRTLSSFVCLLALVAILAGGAGLILFQAGTVLRDSDRYVNRFSEILATLSKKSGGDQVLDSLDIIDSNVSAKHNSATRGANPGAPGPRDASAPKNADESAKPKNEPDATQEPGAEKATKPEPDTARGKSTDDDTAGSKMEADAAGAQAWTRLIHRGMRQAGTWIGSGLGGMLGAVGGVVVFLAYFFYLLETRGEWVERVSAALRRLGLRPTPDQLAKVQQEVVTYFGCLSMVALCYAVVVSLVLWAIGVPQFLLWGVLAGLMEFVPYFGPLIASVAPTIVALSLDSWWQPALVVVQFLALHVVEGYVVTPLVYGKTIRFNPVTILLGALFFGWIWGPLGLAIALPTMIILRGLLAITPDTPALDALADMDDIKEADGTARPSLTVR